MAHIVRVLGIVSIVTITMSIGINRFSGQAEVAKPYTCAVCRYPDYPECAKASPETCKNVVPNGGNKGDCEVVTERGGAQTCKNRFLTYCEDWMRYKRADLKVIAKNFEKVDISKCTYIDSEQAGHSESHLCADAFNTVVQCLQVAPNCKAVDHSVSGCRTFADLAAADAYAEQVKAKLPPGVTVSITGNQLQSSESCKTQVGYFISCERITQVLPFCHTGPFDYCYPGDHGRVSLCRDKDDKTDGKKKEICCLRKSTDLRGFFVQGETCPKSTCDDVGTACTKDYGGVKCTDENGKEVTQKCCLDPKDGKYKYLRTTQCPGEGTFSGGGFNDTMQRMKSSAPPGLPPMVPPKVTPSMPVPPSGMPTYMPLPLPGTVPAPAQPWWKFW